MWRSSDILSPFDFQTALQQADSARVDLHMLAVAPITGLGAVGLPDADISYKYGHASVVLLKGEQELAIMHALAKRSSAPNQPLEVGTIDSVMGSFAMNPNSPGSKDVSSRHRHIPGKPVALDRARTANSYDLFKAYADGVDRHRFRYTVPYDVVKRELALLRKNCEAALMQPDANKEDEKKLVWCDRLLRSPATLSAWAARRISRFPVRARGFNSNSGAHDHAAILGLNILDFVDEKIAPLINRSMLKQMDRRLRAQAGLAGYATAAPDMEYPGFSADRPILQASEPKTLEAA